MAFLAGFSFSSAFLAPRRADSSLSHHISVQFSTASAPPIAISSSTSSLRISWVSRTCEGEEALSTSPTQVKEEMTTDVTCVSAMKESTA